MANLPTSRQVCLGHTGDGPVIRRTADIGKIAGGNYVRVFNASLTDR